MRSCALAASDLVFFCSHQGRVLYVGVFAPGFGGFIGHELGEGRESERHGLGFEFIEVLLELLWRGRGTHAGNVREVVVERQAYERAGFQPHEDAVLVNGLAELRSNAEGECFAVGAGAGYMPPQGSCARAQGAVLGVLLAEDACFVVGVLGKAGVDVFPESFGFSSGVLLAAVFDIGEVAHEALLLACNAESPAVERLEFFFATCYVLSCHTHQP